MNAGFANINDLFGNNVQYRIPLFQRKYVWDNDQWIPLWMDIIDKSVRNEGRVEDNRQKHFTGSIVIRPLTTGPAEVQKYEIIDGQQRLTTFQIILCVLRDICRSGNPDIAEAIDRYIQNKALVEDTSVSLLLPEGATNEQDQSDEKYKLVPNEVDRESLHSVIDGTGYPSNPAYTYFKSKVMEYVGGGSIDRLKILALYNSILIDFRVVAIRIDSNDESERIFESLNARGRQLGDLDHLRNHLFLRSPGRLDTQQRDRLYNELYKDYWKSFETKTHEETGKHYWGTEVREDGEKMTLFELFLRHFLMAKLGTDQIKGPAFEVYQRQYMPTLAKGTTVKTEFSELGKYAEVYEKMVDPKDDSIISRRMEFYLEFGITSLRPFILFVINELEIADNEDSLISFFDALESYTMRRLLCSGKYGFKNCDMVFSRLNQFFVRYCNFSGIKRLSLEDIVRWLSNQDSDFHKWPSDEEVKSALQGGWAEQDGEPKIIRYVLYQIELMRQENNRLTEGNPLRFDNQLTLEHIMPENWTDKWTLPVNGDFIRYEDMFSDKYKDENLEWEGQPSRDGLVSNDYSGAFDRALDRDNLIQSIGNLTIITGVHNSRLSNRPFSEKKKSFDQNSQLLLNNEIAHRCNSWDVEEIRKRTDELFEDFCKKWKSAERFTTSIDKPLLMSDKMIQSETYQPVLITYEGPIETSQILEVGSYQLRVSINGDEQIVDKDSILFTCSATAWSALGPHLQIKNDVKEERLQAVKEPKRRFNIKNTKINAVQNQQLQATVVTRSGHVLQGKVEFFDQYAIYMQIHEHAVIVYRHGLHDFLTEIE